MQRGPWVYPLAAYGDSNIKIHRMGRGHLPETAQPRMLQSFLRKVLSRFDMYKTDFPLQTLLYDINLAKTLSGTVHTAARLKMSPEALSDDYQYYGNIGNALPSDCRTWSDNT